MDDNAIIELFGERDERALSEVSDKYGRLCRGVAYNILGSEQDADECLNDTLAALWSSIPPAAPLSLGAYACGVARNLAHKRFDYNTAARRRTQNDISLDELAECLPDTASDDAGARLGEAINGFLATLTPEARRVFVRRYWMCESIADVARACGMSQAAVKTLLHRLRGRLKKYLEKEGITV